MTRRSQAEEVIAKANDLLDQQRWDEAAALYEEAAALDSKWAVPLFNLGLVFKQQKKWKESLQHNRRAVAVDPKHEGAWWNMGIAATALGRWNLARQAWQGFGIQIPDGQGPIDFSCGFGPFRLHPDGDSEIVWGYRLDPARAELASIPFPESGHRWRDIILNDGAPVGYRKYQGKEVPVLNALELLTPSPFGTFVADVEMPDQQELAAQLAEIAAKLEGCAEDWTMSVRFLCKACSEGRVHATHDTDAKPKDGNHIVGIAARDRDHATKILNRWEEKCSEVKVLTLGDTLPRT